jgi:hypothetical protein
VLERINKSWLLEEEEKLGYQSIHYLVQFGAVRCGLPEYARFAGMTAEIQVRTILQHAWAEIEHDIQYKAVEAIPVSIQRRFMSLAGLRHPDPARRPVGERDAELRLELGDLLRQRGLGHQHPGRGAREAALLRQGHEVSQLAQIDWQIL